MSPLKFFTINGEYCLNGEQQTKFMTLEVYIAEWPKGRAQYTHLGVCLLPDYSGNIP